MKTRVHILSELAGPQDGEIPKWIHIAPAGRFTGRNGVGPFTLDDPQAVIRNSMASGKVVVDVNHSTDLKGPKGEDAPAVGWITDMEMRPDGIWGLAEWNRAGRHMMTEKQYRGQSPVIESAPDGRVLRILRVALTNTPNLTLTTLHSETSMDRNQILASLGLPATATDAELQAALVAARSQVTLHSQLAQAVGVDAATSPAAIIAAVQARMAGEGEAVTQLQKEVSQLRAEASRANVESLMAAASADGVAISDEMRASMITLHAENADLAKTIIASWPRTQLAQRNVTLHTQGAAGSATGSADALLSSLAVGFGVTPDEIRAEMERAHVA